MKRFVVSLGVVGVLFTASSALAQRGPACTTLACDVQADWAMSVDGLMGIANAMPEGEYGFKPTPAQQSFAERIMHVVTFDVKTLSTLPFLGPTASRTRVVYFLISHAQDIYGQLAVYLRLKGVTPPRSNRP